MTIYSSRLTDVSPPGPPSAAMFGIIGNGLANDTAGWNRAIAAINAGTTSGLYIPMGYNILLDGSHSKLITASDWSIFGDGRNAARITIASTAGTAGTFFTIGADDTTVNRWNISGIGLYNENTATLDGTEAQIVLVNARKGTVSNIYTEHASFMQFGMETGTGVCNQNSVNNIRGLSYVPAGGKVFAFYAGSGNDLSDIHIGGNGGTASADFRSELMQPRASASCDSNKFGTVEWNYPTDGVQIIREWDATGGTIVNTITDGCVFDHALTHAFYAHVDSTPDADARLQNNFFSGCRFNETSGGTDSAVKFVNTGDVTCVSNVFMGCKFISWSNTPLVIEGVTGDNNEFQFIGCGFLDRKDGGSPKDAAVQIGNASVLITASKVSATRSTDVCKFNTFVTYTDDVPKVHLIDNDFSVCLLDEAIDISNVTAGTSLVISGNIGPTKHNQSGLYDDGGAPGNGTDSDTAALQSVWDAGRTIRMNPAKSYFGTTALVHPGTADLGIEGNGATLIMSTASGHFTNTVSGSSGGTNARAIICAGASNAARISKPFIRDLTIQTSAWVDDRWVGAIRLAYADDFDISNVVCSGFSRGAMVRINNVNGGKIVGCTFKDSYTNSVTAGAQLTGIESDGSATVITDADGSTYSSKDVLIHGNTFSNLTMSYAATVALGNQTDGINLQGDNSVASPKPTRNFRITGNHFYNVGEGVDCWGNDNIISGNTFRRCMNFAVKTIYGASRNIISENSIIDSGLAGIALEGQTSTYSDSDANMVLNNSIKGVAGAGDWQNADGNLMWDATAAGAAWGSSTANAGIRINFADISPASVVTNAIIAGNIIDCDGTGKYGIWVDNTPSSTATNTARLNKISNFTLSEFQDSGSFLLQDNATAAQIRANTASKVLTTDKTYDALAEVTLTDAATIAVDMNTFLNAIVTLGGNRTLGQPSNAKIGQTGHIRIVQDGTGSRTLAYHADWKFEGGTDPVLTTTASATDILFYEVIAANFIFASLTKGIA